MRKLGYCVASLFLIFVARAATETVGGVEWAYTVSGGKAQVGTGYTSAISQSVIGSVKIPSTLGDCPVTSIGNHAFDGCSGLTSVEIPSSVTNIGDCAFDGCNGLTSVAIPSSVTKIGISAFYSCSGLMSVTIPSGVMSIGSYAFSHCSRLTMVTIPLSVTKIGGCAFSHCSGLMSYSVDAGNPTYSAQNGLLCTKDGSVLVAGVNGYVTIPSSVTSIGDCAFYGCSGLTSVAIPSSVTSIGSTAFYGCSGLTSVTIPSSVIDIMVALN